MRKHRRIIVSLIALAVVLAPVVCVCADGMVLEGAVTAVADTRADCHSKAPDVADQESCTGCDDGAPANLSKTKSDALDPGPLGLDFAATHSFVRARYTTPLHHHLQFRQPTPVTLNVVLLN